MKKGFTLIELMIALAIFSIFALFVYNSYYNQIRVSTASNNTIDLEYNTSKVMRKVVDKVREENKVISLTKEEDIITGVIKFICNGETLVEVRSEYDIQVNISNTSVKSIDELGIEDEDNQIKLVYIKVIGMLREDETNKVILNSTINISK